MLLIPLAIPALLVVSVVRSCALASIDSAYRRGTDYAGDLKVLENDFRRYFYGRQDYPAVSLEELEARHVLSGLSSQTLRTHQHEFVPFTPQTPDADVVLTIHGAWPQPDRFTKGSLTTVPPVPDPAPPATRSPSASPAPSTP